MQQRDLDYTSASYMHLAYHISTPCMQLIGLPKFIHPDALEMLANEIHRKYSNKSSVIE
jgi:hypothetical protein